MKNLINVFVFILILLPEITLADDKSNSMIDKMTFCVKAEDCVQAPDVHTSCFHFCKDKECAAATYCPLFNKNFKNFPDCARSVPCVSNLEGIVCTGNSCQRKEKKSW